MPALLRAPAPYRGKRLEATQYGEAAAAERPAAAALEKRSRKVGFEESGGAMILWPSRAR